MKIPRLQILVALCLLSLVAGVRSMAVTGTAFTFQGRLDTNGVPFDGSIEMQFTLWTAETEGTLLATSRPPTVVVGVVNGLFTVPLDFGAEPFDGHRRWMEIAVRTTDSPFSTLSPRQTIRRTPQAIFAAGVNAAGIIGTISATNLGGYYDQSVTFSNAANTFIGTFAGDGSGLTALNAANLVGSASINTTGNAATATNVNYGGSVTTSNVIVSTPSSDITNSYVFIGYGGIQLPNALYGQGSLGLANTNWRNGIEWWGQGISSPQSWTEWLVQPSAFIHVWDNWGGGASSPGSIYPTMHMGSLGNIRIEAGFGGAAPASSYITLGNEDSNQKLRVNYVSSSTTNGVDGSGYSLPLYFDSVGIMGGQTVGSGPAIQGWFAGTNGGIWPGDGMTLGELSFLSRGPLPDTDAHTFGRQNPTYHYEVGRMRTNGWWFRGPVNQEQSTVLGSGTNVVLDFNAASAQTINLAYTGTTTNRLYTSNVNIYRGNTNFESRTFRLVAGPLARPLRWPNWTFVSELGPVVPPTLLPAMNILYLKLESWGDGETNIVCQFKTGIDTTYAFDSNAQTFITAAGITNATQKGALDYLAKSLKVANLWTNLVALYPFIGGTSNAHAINFAAPASYPITFTSSGVTHDANGITGNGSSGYGNTGINLALVLGASSGQTNAHIAVYCRTTAPTDGGAFFGAATGSGYFIAFRSGTFLGGYGPMTLSGPNNYVDLSSDFRGMLGYSRDFSTGNVQISTRLGVTTISLTPTGVPATTLHLLADNNGAVPHMFSSANLAFASVGYGLTAAQCATFTAIVKSYETILGRNVP